MPTANELEKVAIKLAVDEKNKYIKKNGQTFCNFFVRDFGKILLGETPEELKGRAKQQVAQMEASPQWKSLGFSVAGDDDTKQQIFEDAQRLANAGTFIVAGAKAPHENPRYSGHVAVIVPSQEKNGGLAQKSGSWGLRCPLIAHAGNKIYQYKGLNYGFGKEYKTRLELYAFQPQEAAPEGFLGSFDLQRGDNDEERRWGGQLRSYSGGRKFVKELQKLLDKLGFAIVGEPTGTFDVKTEWAVREFQLYASAPKGAILQNATASLPHEQLKQIDLNETHLNGEKRYKQYTGRIHGAVDKDTRTILENWKNEKRHCPVVLTAFELNSSTGAPLLENGVVKSNLWSKDDFSNTAPRIFALDYSGFFDPQDEKWEVYDYGYIAVGSYVAYNNRVGIQSKASWGYCCWKSQKITPDNLIGKSATALSEVEQQTFSVIRSVAETEVDGYFDELNAYDSALISAGIFHWTAGGMELFGYAAYLQHMKEKFKEGFHNAFVRFGIKPSEKWLDGKKNIFQGKSDRTYKTRCIVETINGNKKLINGEENYLVSWHWFYRFIMLSRTDKSFQRGMWDFCRLRLRDLLSARLRNDANIKPNDSTLGDIFSSQKSAAILLRCHVNSPGHIIYGGKASQHISVIIEAVRQANPGLLDGPPQNWPKHAEEKLIDQLLARINDTNLPTGKTIPAGEARFPKTIRDTLPIVTAWPGLDVTREFQLAIGDLSQPSQPKQGAAIQIVPPHVSPRDSNLKEIGIAATLEQQRESSIVIFTIYRR